MLQGFSGRWYALCAKRGLYLFKGRHQTTFKGSNASKRRFFVRLSATYGFASYRSYITSTGRTQIFFQKTASLTSKLLYCIDLDVHFVQRDAEFDDALAEKVRLASRSHHNTAPAHGTHLLYFLIKLKHTKHTPTTHTHTTTQQTNHTPHIPHQLQINHAVRPSQRSSSTTAE